MRRKNERKKRKREESREMEGREQPPSPIPEPVLNGPNKKDGRGDGQHGRRRWITTGRQDGEIGKRFDKQ